MSSSISRSWLRVTRKVWWATMSMPPNNWPRWEAMTSSRGTKRPGATAMKRGSSGGTLTRAKRMAPVRGSRTCTARLRDWPEM